MPAEYWQFLSSSKLLWDWLSLAVRTRWWRDGLARRCLWQGREALPYGPLYALPALYVVSTLSWGVFTVVRASYIPLFMATASGAQETARCNHTAAEAQTHEGVGFVGEGRSGEHMGYCRQLLTLVRSGRCSPVSLSLTRKFALQM